MRHVTGRCALFNVKLHFLYHMYRGLKDGKFEKATCQDLTQQFCDLFILSGQDYIKSVLSVCLCICVSVCVS